MLIGEFHHNIDDKNRLIIPAKFREDIGLEFVLTRGLDGCLFVYSLGEWEKIVNKLQALPFTKKDARTFKRFFLSGATICNFDKQGRINIPSPLMTYASIQKECVIIGVDDRLEIWDATKFNSLALESDELMSDITENLFDSNGEF